MVRGLLPAVASLSELRLRCTGSDSRGHGLSSCGSGACLFHGTWNLPRPKIEPHPLHAQADSHPLDHQGSPLLSLYVHRQSVSYIVMHFAFLT